MITLSIFLLRQYNPVDISPSLQAALIGIVAGVFVGLFYYQSYRRNYYWWFSMIAGLFASFLVYKLFPIQEEGEWEIWKVFLQFGFPLLAAWAMNRYLKSLKAKSRRRKKSRRNSQTASAAKAEDLFNGPR